MESPATRETMDRQRGHDPRQGQSGTYSGRNNRRPGPYPVSRPTVSGKQHVAQQVKTDSVAEKKQLSDVREHDAQNRILHALTRLFESQQEEMFVVVNLTFDNYLNYAGGYETSKAVPVCNGADAAGVPSTVNGLNVLPPGMSQQDYAVFPRPRDLSPELQRGRFDILMISKQHGFVICEIKTVGDTLSIPDMGKLDEHKSIRKRISKALQQLNKEETVLRHLVKDIDPNVPIRKAFILPNLKRQNFLGVLLQDQGLKKKLTDHWKQSVDKDFPDRHQRTTVVPPVCFHRGSYRTETIANLDVTVQIPSKQLSDVREHDAQNRILHALTRLFESQQEEMFVVVNLTFDNYLNYAGGYETSKAVPVCNGADAAGVPSTVNGLNVLPPGMSQQDYAVFPRPRDLSPELQRGRFDILMISKQHGFVICEIKTVGDTLSIPDMGKHDEHNNIKKRISKALQQLNKEETVLRHLVKDIDPNVPIRKAFILPNLKRQNFLGVLLQDQGLKKVEKPVQALKSCVFSDHMPPVGQGLDIDQSVMEQLKKWWKHLVSDANPTPMSDEAYNSVIARFCGPATSLHVQTATQPRADVRTVAKAVQETARCSKATTLFEEQIKEHLDDPRDKERVKIITTSGGRLVDVIDHLVTSSATLQREKNENRSTLFQQNAQRASDSQKMSSQGISLHLIMDEVPWFFEQFVQLFEQKLASLGTYSLWAASVYHGTRPKSFKEEKLARSRRCPPVVVKEIERGAAWSTRAIYPYTTQDVGVLTSLPPPTDGPPVKRIQHVDHGPVDVWECETCGRHLGRYLTTELRLSNGPESPCSGLTFKDILISGYVKLSPDTSQTSSDTHMPHIDSDLEEDCEATEQHRQKLPHQHTSGLLRGLQAERIPFDVIRKGDHSLIRELAQPSENRVQVADPECIMGLERAVVVVIGTDDVDATVPRYVDPWCDVIARCLSQLVIIAGTESRVDDLSGFGKLSLHST
ncbi:hypothetical protein BaRGS_00011677 [Batillaria attramentaria]|uniref:NERD domain-containing protein n=1 Tax=Batillaria attramentaria TaxID=370345 RepID=A0ABD0LC42_9CAEN